MLQKKMFKVLGRIEKRGKGGGEFLMRLGTGFENRDQSINFYLDAVPKDLEFQIRPLDEADLKKMEQREQVRDREIFNSSSTTNTNSIAADARV